MAMSGQHLHPKTDIEDFKGSPHELKRARFVYVLLQTQDVEQARQLSGLGKHALKRLIERWGEAGTVKDRQHSGRPTDYGPD
jgi:transposase